MKFVWVGMKRAVLVSISISGHSRDNTEWEEMWKRGTTFIIVCCVLIFLNHAEVYHVTHKRTHVIMTHRGMRTISIQANFSFISMNTLKEDPLFV